MILAYISIYECGYKIYIYMIYYYYISLVYRISMSIPSFRWVISSVRNWDARSLPETTGGGSGGSGGSAGSGLRERENARSPRVQNGWYL